MQKIKNWLRAFKEATILLVIETLLENGFLFRLFHKTVKFFRREEKSVREKVANQQIDRFQANLIKLANQMHEDGEIGFRSGLCQGAEEGGYWIMVDDSGQKVPGEFLFDRFGKESIAEGMAQGLLLNHELCQDFHLLAKRNYVLMRIGGERGDFLTKQEIMAQGEKWIFGKLLMWSGSIVEAELMSHQEIVVIYKDLQRLIFNEGVRLFDYCHGNIVGNRIFFPEGADIPHLLGMQLVIRPGRGGYDFLRALAWCLLELPEYEGKEEIINKCLGKLLSIKTVAEEQNSLLLFSIWVQEDFRIRLIFALLCIGVLGWDMLHLGNLGRGDAIKKKEILLRFIRREN